MDERSTDKNISDRNSFHVHNIDFWKFVVHNLPIAVLTVDADLKITSFNAWAEKITGFSEEEVRGSYCNDILCGDQCAGGCPLKSVFESPGNVVQMETTIKNRKNKTIPVRISTVGLFDDNNDLIGGVEAFQDISYLKRLEREKDNMASMFAHDMKSPLIGMDGFALRCLKLLDKNDKAKGYLNIMLKEIRRLEVIIDDFLEFSRLRSGSLKFNFDMTSLDKELDELIEVYRPQASSQGISLEFHAEDPLPIIRADARRLYRVFSNLLNNAIKFSSQGGMIRIKTQAVNKEIRIIISDQGIGIDPDDLPYIFEPFYRGKRLEKKEGFGVGLAAVKTIIEGHGGNIIVKSEAGKGSSFTVVLPESIDEAVK